jgi:hypothetical protein
MSAKVGQVPDLPWPKWKKSCPLMSVSALIGVHPQLKICCDRLTRTKRPNLVPARESCATWKNHKTGGLLGMLSRRSSLGGAAGL